MGQRIWDDPAWPERLSEYLAERGVGKLLLVCGRSFGRLPVRERIEALPVELVRFSGFASNPVYEDVCRGVEVYREAGCEGILAVGGGSAIDVAKCVKLFCRMDPSRSYLEQEPRDSGDVLIAMPTTAGTGSESTHFAVVYYRGVKQSVTHESILPDAAVLEPAVLEALPEYQKKCTMLDALCQGIESWWSVNSTDESREYARRAVRQIVGQMEAYLAGAGGAAREIMLAANMAGRAINITQTTAPHAMSYKLTGIYGLPHGHAVAVCLPEVWEYMLAHADRCADRRGEAYLRQTLDEIAGCITCGEFRGIMRALGMGSPVAGDRERDLQLLTGAVDPKRLKNNPVTLDDSALRALYERIVK